MEILLGIMCHICGLSYASLVHYNLRQYLNKFLFIMKRTQDFLFHFFFLLVIPPSPTKYLGSLLQLNEDVIRLLEPFLQEDASFEYEGLHGV